MLTDGNKTVGSAIFLHFNYEHFDKTGELIAWPSWQTLMTETALGKTAIHESIAQLEQFRLLEVERGRYDHTAQRRAGNIYHVPPRFAVTKLAPRFATKVRDQGSQCEQDSTNRLGESRLGERKKDIARKRKKVGLPRKEGQEEESKQEPREDLPSPSNSKSFEPVKTPYPPSSARPPSPRDREDRWADRWRREKAEAEATLEHYRTMALAAKNGGGP